MTFMEAVARMPLWLRIWMNIVGPVPALTLATWLFHGETRIAGAICLALFALGVVVVLWLYKRMGMVRLLGVGHVVFWTPIPFILWSRLTENPPPTFFEITGWIALAVVAISLVFDTVDTIKWIAGDREPTVTPADAPAH